MLNSTETAPIFPSSVSECWQDLSPTGQKLKGNFRDFTGGPVAKTPGSQCRGSRFDPWVGKIPWRREQLHTPIFWLREFHGLSMGLQRVRHN